MSLWSTLPPDQQLLTEPADEADLALVGEQDERADLAAYRRERRRARTRRLGTGVLGLAVLALLWQLIATLINDPVFLPSVSQTVASFAHYFGRPYPSQGKPLWFDALTSLRRILIGFAGGTVIGVALGAGMSASRVVRHAIDPVIEVLRPLPPLAFIPLFIIWLGHRRDAQRGPDPDRRGPDHGGGHGRRAGRGARGPAAVRPHARRVAPLHHAAGADPGRAAR